METIPTQLKDGFIKLSEPLQCSNCGQVENMVGELRSNGNWYCPNCGAIQYLTSPKIVASYVRYGTTSDSKSKLLGGPLMPLGTPPPVFPSNSSTGFLIPSYSYKIVRKKKILVEATEDFTRTGRIKSAGIWAFELGFNSRAKTEFDTLMDFWEAQGYHNPFTYTDPFKGTSHTCYFDSEVSSDTSSFDEISFSFRITE